MLQGGRSGPLSLSLLYSWRERRRSRTPSPFFCQGTEGSRWPPFRLTLPGRESAGAPLLILGFLGGSQLAPPFLYFGFLASPCKLRNSGGLVTDKFWGLYTATFWRAYRSVGGVLPAPQGGGHTFWRTYFWRSYFPEILFFWRPPNVAPSLF